MRSASRTASAASACASSQRSAASSLARTAATDLGRDVVLRGGLLAHVADLCRLVVAALGVERLREHRGGAGEQRLLAHLLEPLVAPAQPRLGGGRRPRAARRAPPVARPRTAGRPARSGSRPRSATSRRASSKSPAIACRAAVGCSVRATATGLLRTCSRISSQQADRLRHRRGAEQGAGRPPAEDLEQRRLVARRGGRARRLAEGLVGVGAAALDPGSQRPQPQRPALAELVAVRLEHAQGRRRRPARSDAAAGPGLEPNELLLDARAAERGRRPPARARSPRRGPVGVRQPPGLDSAAPSAAGARARRIVGGRAPPPARAAAPAAARRRAGAPPAAPLEPLGRLASRARGRARRPARARPGAVGLAEVVADRLVVCAGALARASRRRARAAPPRAAWAAAVGGLADQRVREPERVLAGEVGAVRADQLLLHERHQVRRRRPVGSPSSSASAPTWKLRPWTEACSSTARSPGSSRSMRAASTAWMLDGSAPLAVLGADRDELLEEERVALGRLDDPLRRAGVHRRRRRALTSLARLGVESASSTSSERFGCGAPAGRSSRSSGRARQTSRIGWPLENATRYSSRSSSVGSAQWTSSTTTTSGRSRADPLEQPADGPERLLRRGGSSDRPIAPSTSRAIGVAVERRRAARASAPSPSRPTISASGR